MKVTKSYIKQLIMEELSLEGEEGGATFGEGDFASAKKQMSRVRDTLKGEKTGEQEIKALLAPLEQHIQQHPEEAELLKRMLSNMLRILPGR